MPNNAKAGDKFSRELLRRIERHKAFYSRNEPGDLLILPNPWSKVNLAARLAGALCDRPVGELLSKPALDAFVDDFLADFRADLPAFYSIPGDAVPTAPVFAHIGAVTAAMTGLAPTCRNGTVMLDANLPWGRIAELSFDADNPWIQLALELNRALWRRWEQDYFIMPYFHRTPLDAAQGIRGADLFTDMYDQPDRVKALLNWCADWAIQVEQFLRENVDRADGWGCGIWNCWLPEGAVVANGDAVGMISRDMQPLFEGPYTERFFSATAGGLFHNHGIGLHQVDLVARTKGVLIQEILPDPNQPHPVKEILTDRRVRDRIVQASLDSPIRLDGIASGDLPELLEIVKQGRFILCVPCDDLADAQYAVDLVRASSNLD